MTAAQDGLIKNAEVNCSYKELVDPKTLKPHPKNPNEHSAEQIDLFVSILGYQGWRRPITVSKLSGYITKGHGALEAALHAGYALVPVDFQDYADENQEMADIVADNQLARMSTMNTGKLKSMMVDLNTGHFDMKLTGFGQVELNKLVGVKAEPVLNLGSAPTPPPVNGGLVGAPVMPGQPLTKGEGPAGGPPVSQVRMVQLFFNEETQAEFLEMCEFFQTEFESTNLTDTVIQVIRRAYQASVEGESSEGETAFFASEEGGEALEG